MKTKTLKVYRGRGARLIVTLPGGRSYTFGPPGEPTDSEEWSARCATEAERLAAFYESVDPLTQ